MLTDFKGIFFLAVCVITVFALSAVKNKKRFLLSLFILFFPFSTGLIFYRYHGIMLADFPLFVLLILLISENKKWVLPKECIPAIVFIVWAFISATQAWQNNYAISETLRSVRGFLIFIVIINSVKTTRDLKIVLNMLFIGLLFQSLLAIYQWRFGYFGLRFLGETTWVSWRTRGTFQHESYFGHYLITLIPIAIRLFMFYRPKNKNDVKIYGAITVISVLALFTNFVRGPWISFAVAVSFMIIYSLFRKKFRPKMYWPIAIVLVFMAAFFVRYLPKILSQFDPEGGRMVSADIRLPLIRVSQRMIAANPIFGVGMGNYQLHCADYVVEEKDLPDVQNEQLKWDIVHNTFFLLMAETGVLGGLMFIVFIIFIFRRGKQVTKSSNPYFFNLAVGIITGFSALMIAFQNSPDYRIHQINVITWLISGLIIALHELDKKYQKMLKYHIYKRKKEMSIGTTSDSLRRIGT